VCITGVGESGVILQSHPNAELQKYFIDFSVRVGCVSKLMVLDDKYKLLFL